MTTEDLLAYLHDTAGEYHRGTVRYDGSEVDVRYSRSDAEEFAMQSRVDRLLDRLRPEATPAEERAFPFEDMLASVRVFETAVVVHFRTGHDRGVVVSLDPETATALTTFVGECVERIER